MSQSSKHHEASGIVEGSHMALVGGDNTNNETVNVPAGTYLGMLKSVSQAKHELHILITATDHASEVFRDLARQLNIYQMAVEQAKADQIFPYAAAVLIGALAVVLALVLK